jgi:TRAP-type C4-dicarboxylate transport system substrate-binding protein
MERKSLVIATCFLLAVTLFMGGCNRNASEDKFSEKETADDKKVYTLTFSTWLPEADNKNMVVRKAWFNYLEKASGGRLIIDDYYSEQLAAADSQLLAIQTGIADIADIYSAYVGYLFPLNQIFTMPFAFQSPDNITLAKVYNEMIKTHPEFLKEFEAQGVKFLHVHTDSGTQIMTNEPIRTLSDWKGKIIYSGSEIERRAISMLGCTPTFVAPTELYDALTKGVVDGSLSCYTGAVMNSVVDASTYVSDICMAHTTWVVAINLDVYNSLPTDLQALLTGENGELMTELYGYQFFIDELLHKSICLEKMKEIEIDEAEMNTWKQLVAPLKEEWIDNVNTKGYDGRKIYDDFTKLINEYTDAPVEAKWPNTLIEWGATLPDHWQK